MRAVPRKTAARHSIAGTLEPCDGQDQHGQRAPNAPQSTSSCLFYNGFITSWGGCFRCLGMHCHLVPAVNGLLPAMPPAHGCARIATCARMPYITAMRHAMPWLLRQVNTISAGPARTAVCSFMPGYACGHMNGVPVLALARTLQVRGPTAHAPKLKLLCTQQVNFFAMPLGFYRHAPILIERRAGVIDLLNGHS